MLTYAPLNFIAIGIGATLGAWLRWVLGLRLNGAGWPWGTLTANLVGGYLIGVMVALIASHPEWPAWIRLAAVTGFLGGLTTFSTFSAETVDMLERSLAMTGLGLATVRLLLR
ncbi:camphor resistance protein CrcB [Bordetella pertussis]|nr:CrcB family protein [Bordetella pertussis]CFE03168.1 camphor resistance protein CrcB [Bordetella pertussis]